VAGVLIQEAVLHPMWDVVHCARWQHAPRWTSASAGRALQEVDDQVFADLVYIPEFPLQCFSDVVALLAR